MFLATSILPEALGIEWGMSRKQCLSLMSETRKGRVKAEGSTIILVGDGDPLIELSFDAQGKLETTNAVLCQSRHWFVGYDPDEVRSTWKKYVDHYNHVVKYHSKVLGPPDFSGDHTMEGFPKHTDASIITYWNHPSGRILIGIEHRDEKLPIVVRVTCQRVKQLEKSICWKHLQEVPLRVTDIEPSALGLKWNDTKEQCLTTYGDSLLRQAPNMLDVNLTLQDETYRVSLWIDDKAGLTQIEVMLCESQWFWNCSIDETLAVYQEYEACYENLVRLHRKILGPPDFSGDYREKGFPDPQYAGQADKLTYWDKPEGRMQIGIGQEDRETPVFVKMICYRT